MLFGRLIVYRDGSVMVWGGIYLSGRTPVYVIQGSLTANTTGTRLHAPSSNLLFAMEPGHTTSIALPPNSARIGYATYFRASVHRRCQRPPKGLGTKKTVEVTERRNTSALGKKNQKNQLLNRCQLHTYCHLSFS